MKKGAIIAFALLCVVVGQLLYNNIKGSRVFYVSSLIVAICAIVLFYLSFEGRKPKEREVVLACVMCGVAVVSRVLFFMIPQFKPMGAIIIICAVWFGREFGFLVGSLSSLVSNSFFGQGPFTPFTMLGFGLIGYFAGVLFYKRKPKTWVLCIYGFIATFIIYGGIANFSSLMLFSDTITWSYAITVFAMAFYFDLVHSASVALFLGIFNKGLSKRFERIVDRYGVFELNK